MIEWTNTRLLMKTLMYGHPAKIDGRVYRMSEDFELIVEMDMFTDGVKNDTPFYGMVDFTIGGFVQLARNMTAEEKFELAATLTLND